VDLASEANGFDTAREQGRPSASEWFDVSEQQPVEL
jgi:hypothetical protein